MSTFWHQQEAAEPEVVCWCKETSLAQLAGTFLLHALSHTHKLCRGFHAAQLSSKVMPSKG